MLISVISRLRRTHQQHACSSTGDDYVGSDAQRPPITSGSRYVTDSGVSLCEGKCEMQDSTKIPFTS
jgi:hypothetical protein